ncbi:hypothetical protein QT397_08220 [Microbulbifer sp. MKSA007]|nr:hypothetical protein QT397_08220 [Microbulbifer sp. MKSA007]
MKGYLSALLFMALTVFAIQVSGYGVNSIGAESSPDNVDDIENIFIDSDTTILETDNFYSGKNIVVDGVVLTLTGKHSFNRLEVVNNGHVTALVNEIVDLEVTTTLIVSAESSINLDGKGLIGSGSSYYGASHGGTGGGLASDTTYGDFAEPTSLGTSHNSHARGGGAIKLTVDKLILDGGIYANGVQPAYYGGSSGGSIWVIANTISGLGELSANGGDSANSSSYYGGGGGRIALYYGLNEGFDFNNIQAKGGNSYSSSKEDGGSGSTYINDQSTGEGRLGFIGLNKNSAQSLFQDDIPANTSVEFVNTNLVLLGDVSGITSTEFVNSNVTIKNPVPLKTLILKDSSLILNTTGIPQAEGNTLQLDGSYLSIYPNSTDVPPTQWDSVVLSNQSSISHEAVSGDGDSLVGINWDVGYLLVDKESFIDSSGRGLIGGSTSFYGASHGGTGGGLASDTTYGDFAEPTSLGTSLNSHARGGGAIKLTVDKLILDGGIYANGVQPAYYGGSSGGSIWVIANTISGLGELSANGGDSANSSSYYGGGGGRIALYYGLNEGFDFNNIQAKGGNSYSSSKEDGGSGSTYINDQSTGEGRLGFIGLNKNSAQSLFQDDIPANTSVEFVNTNLVLLGDVSGITSTEFVNSNVTIKNPVPLKTLILKDSSLILNTTGIPQAEGNTLQLDGSYLSIYPNSTDVPPTQWDSVVLSNQSSISHEAVSGDGDSLVGINWDVGYLLVDKESFIDSSGRGLIGGSTSFYGASHGGTGGGLASDTTYGDFAEPTSLGTSLNSYARGGGAIKLTVDKLILDGGIYANGVQPAYYGGSSGGSIWVIANTISGLGELSANGGDSANSSSYYGGGGGRIALYYGLNEGFDFNNIQAKGGNSYSSSKEDGGSGSTYINDQSTGEGRLGFIGLNKNSAQSLFQDDIPANTSVEFVNTNLVLLGDVSGITSTEFVNSNVTIKNPVPLKTLILKDSSLILNTTGIPQAEGNTLQLDGSYLSIYPNSTDVPPTQWDSVVLSNQSSISHEAVSGDGDSLVGINWDVGYLLVDKESFIDSSGRGLIGGSTSFYGASHGGTGGGLASDTTYGDFAEPTSLGTSLNSYARGGGAIKLTVDKLILDGGIYANGVQPAYYGGSSGGSIWVIANTISGLGELSANGGDSANSSSYYGGGGGRIALYYGLNEGFDFNNIQAKGGNSYSSSKEDGGSGSTYINDQSTGEGRLGFIGLNKNSAQSLFQDDIPANTSVEFVNTNLVLLGDVSGITSTEFVNSNVTIKNPVPLKTLILKDSSLILNTTGIPQAEGNTLQLDGSYLSIYPNSTDVPPTQWDSVVLSNQSSISHEAVSGDGDSLVGINWDVGYLLVDKESFIDSSGRGLIGGSTSFYGASHGGTGGGLASDTTYGDFAEPTSLGTSLNSYARGGGAIKLTVDKLILDGGIYANGVQPAYYGGSSGGSIWVIANTISGLGELSANGGDSANSPSYYGGGGGRIALYYGLNEDFDFSKIEAKGEIHTVPQKRMAVMVVFILNRQLFG